MVVINLKFLYFCNCSEWKITVSGKEFVIQKSMIKEVRRYQKDVHGKLENV